MSDRYYSYKQFLLKHFTDKEQIDSIFSCYDKKVMAPIKDVLSSEEA